jgi:hypothetical protein
MRRSIPKYAYAKYSPASGGSPSPCQRASVSGQKPIVSQRNGRSMGSKRHVARNRSRAFILSASGGVATQAPARNDDRRAVRR